MFFKFRLVYVVVVLKIGSAFQEIGAVSLNFVYYVDLTWKCISLDCFVVSSAKVIFHLEMYLSTYSSHYPRRMILTSKDKCK